MDFRGKTNRPEQPGVTVSSVKRESGDEEVPHRADERVKYLQWAKLFSAIHSISELMPR